MATVHVVLARVAPGARYNPIMPVLMSAEVDADTLTSSGTSQLAGPEGQPGQFWAVVATGGNIWVKTGADEPEAASGTGWLVLDGVPMDLAVDVEGEKLAIKDA